MTEFLYGDLTHQIIGTAFEVYKNLGYGFLEKVYENAFSEELKRRKIDFKRQYPIKVYYKGTLVGEYIADILVEDKVIVELKAAKEYNNIHEKQLLNYLKATRIKVGLLFNFGENKCEHKRLVF
ncbi:GxxExxY protein [candidate division WOR-3 bacterium]|nr:GxxExxY protein [candidate division WOR-3 bacterium]